MLRQLGVNVRANLLFYRRNRLLLLVAILLAFICLITIVPSFFFLTLSQRFELIKSILETLDSFLFLFAAALGLVGVSSHLRDRSIKMVMTKPVLPELWLFSHFVSATLVLTVLVAGSLLLVGGLFLFWDLPLQNGMLALGLASISRCLIVFSYLTFLSVLVHPAVAGVVAMVLQPKLFYQLGLMAASAQELAESGLSKLFYGSLRHLMVLVYKVVPVYEAYPEELSRIGASFRLEQGDLRTVALTALYAATISGLFYLLAVAGLRRRRFI